MVTMEWKWIMRLKGEGNSYDFGARMLDVRVNRWFVPDEKSKADQSNYVAFRNNPIIFVDPDGKDDWYFDFTTNAVYVIKNGKPNRCFITDYIYSQPNNGLSVGSYRTKQYAVNSNKIKTIFTNNIPLYRKALSMYPIGSNNKRGIYKAYDKIDEFALISAVLSPLAAIGAIEAAPFLAAEYALVTESGIVQFGLTEAFTGLSSNFVLNSGKMAAIGGGFEFGTQYLSNVFVNNDYSLGSINYYSVMMSATFKVNSSTILAQSSFKLDRYGFSFEGANIPMNFLFRKTGGKLTSKFNSTIGNSLSNFAPSIGGFLQNIGLTSIKTTVKSVSKAYKNKQKEKKSNNKNKGGILSPRDF